MPCLGEAIAVGLGTATVEKQDAIEAKLDVPANFMADTTALALEATLAVVDGIVDDILADTATINWTDITTIDGIVDDILVDTAAIVWSDITTIDAIVDAIKLKTDTINWANVTDILADTATINWTDITTIDTVVDAIKAKTDTIVWGDITTIDGIVDSILTDTAAINWTDITTIDTVVDAIKAKTDLLPAANFDETDSFLWDTDVYLTDETDISVLFNTNLTGATRRAYAVYLDLTTAEADAAEWTECTIRVKIKVDAANYRTVDLKVIAKTDVAATKEPGVNIDIPPVAQDVQVTMQFDVQLAGDATIPYHYVREALE